ncbi:MAG: hypothetical protein FWF53_05535 [Candidatus Azobacteroides sp.]|nr:hypothetical protein [Candidatus Azobacteroides sp.]
MDLTKELKKLQTYFEKRDTHGFKTYLESLLEKSNQEEKETISSFVESELEKSTSRIKNTVNDIQIRMQVENAIDVL